MQTSFILRAADAIHQAILDSESVLESLDREIGDGDHFINMKRGAAAIVAMRDELAVLSADAALQKIGMKLLSTVGGASGVLLGSFFIAMAKTLKENGSADAAFSAGVEAIKARGKANVGEKTMLDVLIPVAKFFTENAKAEHSVLLQGLKQEAERGVLATRDMIATKGRAAFLGERAIGHIDPGAKSCQIMINAVCDLTSF